MPHGLEIIEIVEDDHSQAKLLDQILRQASFRTNVAFDGPSGMQDVWRIKPALIAADDNLPGLNGREMCKRLRQDPSTKTSPSSSSRDFHRKIAAPRALDGRADDFILKPYSATELLARVRAVRRSRQEPAQDEDQIEDLTLTETLYVAIYRGNTDDALSP